MVSSVRASKEEQNVPNFSSVGYFRGVMRVQRNDGKENAISTLGTHIRKLCTIIITHTCSKIKCRVNGMNQNCPLKRI